MSQHVKSENFILNGFFLWWFDKCMRLQYRIVSMKRKNELKANNISKTESFQASPILIRRCVVSPHESHWFQQVKRCRISFEQFSLSGFQLHYLHQSGIGMPAILIGTYTKYLNTIYCAARSRLFQTTNTQTNVYFFRYWVWGDGFLLSFPSLSTKCFFL